MAVAATLVQSRGQSSSAAAPASFAAAYTGNTTVGNLLIAVIAAADSGAPTIATPTSASGTWLPLTGVSVDQATATSIRAWYMPNNPGGFTAVTFPTLTNINGVATALFEFSGMSLTSGVIDSQSPKTGSASSTTVASGNVTPIYGGEVWLGIIANLTGQALTAANTPSAGLGTWTAGPTATSTVGATNVVLTTFYVIAGPQFPTGNTFAVGGSYPGAISNAAAIISFTTPYSRALYLVYDGVSGFGALTDSGTVSVGG